MTVTADILKGIPLFADLEEVELLQVIACFSLVSVAAGETLYAEGTRATSACFVIDGELEAVTALPGGGEALVGVIGPGELIGEMALIAGGSRTATVRARVDLTAVSVSYAFFQAALNQMSVPAFKILRRIVHKLSTRLEVLEEKIFAAWDCGSYRPSASRDRDAATLAAYDNARAPSFDYGSFLSITPFFDQFEDAEIEQIVAQARVLEVPRDDFIYCEGGETTTSFIVVRGAVDNSIMRDRRYQLSVLGPGRLCGANSAIENKPHRSDGRVRSGALLLAFDAENFRTLFHGTTIEALKFQMMVSRNQLLDLKSADNLLTSLVSQAHVRNSLSATG
jgi:CRP-like cAMP-binding protein